MVRAGHAVLGAAERRCGWCGRVTDGVRVRASHGANGRSRVRCRRDACLVRAGGGAYGLWCACVRVCIPLARHVPIRICSTSFDLSPGILFITFQ